MNKECIGDLLQPIIDRAKSYLEEDMGISLLPDQASEVSCPERISLNKNTAIIATSGRIQIILAIGYDDTLLDQLTDRYLGGESVGKEEYRELREGAACEVANTIIGNVIEDPLDKSPVPITPPIFINGATSLSQYQSIKAPSKTATITLVTEFGEIILSAMGPKELFMDALELNRSIKC